MRGIVTGLAVSTLLISVLPATAGNPQPAVAAQSPERLIDQLGDRDFRVRETAGKALEKMGPAALPALRKARGHADLEVRRRVAQLTQAAERLALLTPQRVTLRISHKSLQEVFAEMSRQTGYKIHFVNEGNGGPKTVYSFDLADVTFWEALDRICATAGLVLAGHGEDGALQAFATDSYVPHVHRVGPFRIK
ncbi:MAG TPA: HEAT repeat domain-containing protein, partial [Gemmataceae bacterium]|nr:HEAT repeat domain-containing protein [Gemmataceae bacterium]